MTSEEIISKLPYGPSFLFVDELTAISENGVIGSYFFNPDAAFYEDHFRGNPITPGVILTECMAQIGVVCLGIFLMGEELGDDPKIAMTNTDIHFLKPVFPGEKVVVSSEKQYFRFGKLKCKVSMKNEKEEEVCNGVIGGMIFKNR